VKQSQDGKRGEVRNVVLFSTIAENPQVKGASSKKVVDCCAFMLTKKRNSNMAILWVKGIYH
jgi:hypothetical protein